VIATADRAIHPHRHTRAPALAEPRGKDARLSRAADKNPASVNADRVANRDGEIRGKLKKRRAKRDRQVGKLTTAGARTC